MLPPLTAEEIAELRKLWDAPTGTWNALDALACIAATVPMFPLLLDEVERSRALLKRIEWSALKDHTYSACPECGGIDTKFHDHEDDPVGHKPGCELAALVGDAK